MSKIDLKKELKDLYEVSHKEPAIVRVPALRYIMADGEGDPNTAAAYKEAVEALFTLSYTIKFMLKKGSAQVDYGVMPLQGLWWTEDMAQFSIKNKNNWKWTAMILQPDHITREIFEAGAELAKKKKPLPALPELRLETFEEGLCAQILHMGPYAAEAPTIEKLHRFIKENDCELTGKHHEIYMSDVRKTAPDKLKTILRQPMKPAAKAPG